MMVEVAVFFFNVLSLTVCGFGLIVAVTAFTEWRSRRTPATKPHPPGARAGLLEPGLSYVLKLKDGERIGPMRFEGYAMRHDGPNDPDVPHSGVAFRKPDGRRVAVNGYDIRTVEEVAPPPGTPAPDTPASGKPGSDPKGIAP